MIIFITILLDKGIITSETFTALLLMAVASTMLTVPVVAPAAPEEHRYAGGVILGSPPMTYSHRRTFARYAS